MPGRDDPTPTTRSARFVTPRPVIPSSDHTGGPGPWAELSSTTHTLEDLAGRMAAMAEALRNAPEGETTASELFEVERLLRGALRRLHRLH